MDHRDEPRNTHCSRRPEDGGRIVELRVNDCEHKTSPRPPFDSAHRRGTRKSNVRHLHSAPRSSFWYVCFALFVTARAAEVRALLHDSVIAACAMGVSLTIENGTVWVSRSMTNSIDSSGTPDPIDEESAEIDARSPNAEEQIEELVEHAKELGRDAKVPGE